MMTLTTPRCNWYVLVLTKYLSWCCEVMPLHPNTIEMNIVEDLLQNIIFNTVVLIFDQVPLFRGEFMYAFSNQVFTSPINSKPMGKGNNLVKTMSWWDNSTKQWSRWSPHSSIHCISIGTYIFLSLSMLTILGNNTNR